MAKTKSKKRRRLPIEETIGSYSIFVDKVGGARACKFSIVAGGNPRFVATGSEPGPCTKALAAARRIVKQRRAMGFGSARRKRRK